jgi:hypothetical protein
MISSCVIQIPVKTNSVILIQHASKVQTIKPDAYVLSALVKQLTISAQVMGIVIPIFVRPNDTLA